MVSRRHRRAGVVDRRNGRARCTKAMKGGHCRRGGGGVRRRAGWCDSVIVRRVVAAAVNVLLRGVPTTAR